LVLSGAGTVLLFSVKGAAMNKKQKEDNLDSLLKKFEVEKDKIKCHMDALLKIRFDHQLFLERINLFKQEPEHNMEPHLLNMPPQPDELAVRYLGRIDTFFEFVNKRLQHASECFDNSMEDVALRETLGMIEVLAFNAFYKGNIEPRNLFTELLLNYGELEQPNDDIIWMLYRNVVVHIGDLPSRFPFDEIYSVKDLIEICLSINAKFNTKCKEARTDPAPNIFRQYALINFKCKYVEMMQGTGKFRFDNITTTHWARLKDMERLRYP
jgi:hypothetical protein